MQYPTEYTVNKQTFNADLVLNGVDCNEKRVLVANIYRQYNVIRTILGGKKCMQPTIAKVKMLLNDTEMREKVHKTVGFSDEKIDFIVDVAENHMEFVR